jgi:hypothetical protein
MNLLKWIEVKIIPNNQIPKATTATIYGVVLGDVCGYSRVSHNELHEMCVPRGSFYDLVSGLPATLKTLRSKFMKLNRKWDNFLYAFFCMASPGWTDKERKAAYARFLASNRCYTNGHGPDRYRSDVLGANQDQPYMAKETIFTTGAILIVLDNARRYLKAREYYFKVYIMDGNKNPPPLPADASISPIVHWATNSARILTRNSDGSVEGREDIINRFPQLHKDNFDGDVPMINMGDGSYDFVPCNRLRILEQGEPWPYPYVFDGAPVPPPPPPVDPPPPPPPDPNTYSVVCLRRTVLRQRPEADSPKIDPVAQEGGVFMIYQEVNGWGYTGVRGWVLLTDVMRL